MRKTTIYLREEVKVEIETVSKMDQRPEAEIIRDALDQYLARRRKTRLPTSFGMIADGSFNAAEDEAYLAEYWKPDW